MLTFSGPLKVFFNCMATLLKLKADKQECFQWLKILSSPALCLQLELTNIYHTLPYVQGIEGKTNYSLQTTLSSFNFTILTQHFGFILTLGIAPLVSPY